MTRSTEQFRRTIRVRRAGGSRVVTLPKALCEAVGIGEGTEVTVRRHGDDAIVIQPVQSRQGLRPRRPIKELLAQGGPTVLHGDWCDSGPDGDELI